MLDETDSGLDIDALKIVSEGVNRFKEDGDKGVLLITHYTRILRYITPDFVHVFVDGRMVEEGGPELAEQLEAEGYDKYIKACGLTSVRSPTTLALGLLPGLEVIRKDFPILERRLERRPAAGLPRQRQHLAEAAGGDRLDGRPPRAAQRQRGPGDAPARRGVLGRLRGGPRQGGARSSTPPRATR